MSAIVTLLIPQIATDDRLRDASPEHVAGLAATIEKNASQGIGHDGLMEPIVVRPLSEIDADGVAFMLISGMHRLEACKLLGRDSIAAVEYDIGAIAARRLEIEENLVRHDLNALDRAIFVAEYREMFEAEYGEVAAGRPDNSNKSLPLWSDAVAERFGIGKMACSRHLRIANGLTLESQRALSGTLWAENQKALLELAGVEVEAQAAVIERLLDPESGFDTMREAIANGRGPTPEDTDEQWLTKSWNRFHVAHKRVKKRLLNQILIDPKEREILRDAAADAGFRLEPIPGGPKGADT